MRKETVLFTGNTLYLGLSGELKTKKDWKAWGLSNNVDIEFKGGPDDN